jgi:uncharacterized protein YegP (UPF0339 family)
VYYIYKEQTGYWRWRLIDGKGMTIVNSAEHYAIEDQCLAAVQLIKQSGLAPVCVLRERVSGEVDATKAPVPIEDDRALETRPLTLLH